MSANTNASGPKPSIFVMDPYHPDAVSALQAASDVEVVLPTDARKTNFYNEATLLLLRSDTRIDAVDISKCRKLQAIVKQGVGTDNIDVKAAAVAGVKVFNTPGLNSESVAELSLAMALGLSRRIPEIDRRIRGGETIVRSKTLGLSLHRKALGLVGMGNIALSFAKKWVGATGGTIIGYDPYANDSVWAATMVQGSYRRVETLDEVLEMGDVISLHVPLTKDTKNIIAAAEFDKMKQNAILINAARGGVVDEQALLQTLASGKLFGVGLDALEVEPPTLETCGKLLNFPNVIVTPHIGASTVENQSLSGVTAAKIALDFVRGCESGNRVV